MGISTGIPVWPHFGSHKTLEWFASLPSPGFAEASGSQLYHVSESPGGLSKPLLGPNPQSFSVSRQECGGVQELAC